MIIGSIKLRERLPHQSEPCSAELAYLHLINKAPLHPSIKERYVGDEVHKTLRSGFGK